MHNQILMALIFAFLIQQIIVILFHYVEATLLAVFLTWCTEDDLELIKKYALNFSNFEAVD